MSTLSRLSGSACSKSRRRADFQEKFEGIRGDSIVLLETRLELVLREFPVMENEPLSALLVGIEIVASRVDNGDQLVVLRDRAERFERSHLESRCQHADGFQLRTDEFSHGDREGDLIDFIGSALVNGRQRRLFDRSNGACSFGSRSWPWP